ncbi:hypothetical protein B0A53_04517 [Rhodotorula sp. CCFEE 5036]|nr:hypothetical protein B0A53_04517 [Rhodotorula sp. CCFEE 5036]
MDSDGDGAGGDPAHQAKKRRVTRACDNCRKRRIKCQAYPNPASIDAPCVICTDAGAPHLCTYSKPPRKRGPQAGKARSLAEKCATLQRLLGYLATTIPNLETYVQDFAAAAAAAAASSSPDPASSASSAASPAMTADAFQQAYESTRIPEILDAILPPLVSARDAAKLKLDQQQHLLPNPPPPPPPGGGVLPTLTYPTSLAKAEQQYDEDPNSSLSYVAADRDAIMTPLDPYQPMFATPSTAQTSANGGSSSSSSIPFVALHALANVAVPDHNKYNHHNYHESFTTGSGSNKVVVSDGQDGAAVATAGAPAAARPLHAAEGRAGDEKAKGKGKRKAVGEDTAAGAIDPLLEQHRQQQGYAAHSLDMKEEVEVFIPDGATRSALLDLYFNQVVQPSFPMLDKSAFLRWSAHLPFGATPVPRPSTSSSSSSGRARPPPATTTTTTTTNNNNSPPPHLYLSIFALASIYVPPSSPLREHLPLEAPRKRELEEDEGEEQEGEGGGGLEAVQSAVLLAMCDWGQGHVDRAWFMSSLALSLAVAQSLHLPSRSSKASNPRTSPTSSSPLPGSTASASASTSSRLKTLHSVLIIHFLLSVRLDRVPLSIALLQDYEREIPPPPTDEVENWDLWRSDKTAGELRREWAATGEGAAEADQWDGGESPDDSVDPARQKTGKGPASSSSNKQKKKGGGRIPAAGGGGGAGAGSAAGGFEEQPALAVASNSLVVFARLAELCQIGTRILRYKLRSAAAAAGSVAGSQQEASGPYAKRQAQYGHQEEEEGQDPPDAFSPEELLRQLQEWEAGLGPDLRIGTTSSSLSLSLAGDSTDAAKGAAVALVKERPRWTVAMHLVLATLQLRLVDTANPNGRRGTATTLKRITQILDQHRAVFTPFRSLPMSELPLYAASSFLLGGEGEAALDLAERRAAARSIVKTARELGRVLPIARRISQRLASLSTGPGTADPHSRNVDKASNAELAAAERKQQAAVPPPTSSTTLAPTSQVSVVPTGPPPPAASAAEPFQAFLSYAQDLGPAAEPSTILDFGSWDQSDLLVSLGLVGAPGPGAGAQAPLSGASGVGAASGSGNVYDHWAAWGAPPPIEGTAMVGEADHDNFPLPVLMETGGLGSLFNQSQSHEGVANPGGMAIDSVGVAGGCGMVPPPLAPSTGLTPLRSTSAGGRMVPPHQSPAYAVADAHSMMSSVASTSASSSVRGGIPPAGGDAMVISPDPKLYALPQASHPAPQPATMAFHHQQQQQQQQLPQHQQNRPDHAAYLPRSVFGTPVPPGGSNMSMGMSMSSMEGQEAYEAALGTDLLTRWLDRGTLAFTTPETTPGPAGGGGGGGGGSRGGGASGGGP